MKKLLFVGVAGVGFVWFLIGWIRARGFLDFFSLVFIVLSILVLSVFTLAVVRGESSG